VRKEGREMASRPAAQELLVARCKRFAPAMPRTYLASG